MKRSVIIAIFLFTAIAISILIIAIFFSFKVVKQNTDKINFALKSDFAKIVRVPEPVGPFAKSFEKTTYVWEMETNQKEVTKVFFTHDTAFSKETGNITATLEMDQAADPGVFSRVLPAVVSDSQVSLALSDPKNINTSANPQIGYSKISIFSEQGKEDQISKIVWEFPRESLVNRHNGLYKDIYSIPLPALKFLYSLQGFIIDIFRS